MLPDRVSNPGPLTYESGALPIALRGPARLMVVIHCHAFVLIYSMCSCQEQLLERYRPRVFMSRYFIHLLIIHKNRRVIGLINFSRKY